MPVAFLDFLTSREQAVLFWAAAGLLFVIGKDRGIVGGFASMAEFLARSWKLLVLFGSAALYAGILVYTAHRYELWHSSSAKETVYWFLGTAVVLAGNTADLTRKPHFLRDLIVKVAGVGFLAVVMEFAINYYTFHFLVEVVLVFLITVSAVAQGVATQPDHAQVRAACRWTLAVIGSVLIAVTAVRALADLHGLLTRANVEALLISPVFTLAFIPFLYAWGLVIGYEHVFMRVGHLEGRRPYPRGVRWAVFRACGFKLRRIRRFTQTQTATLYQLQGQEDVDDMITAFRGSDESARVA